MLPSLRTTLVIAISALPALAQNAKLKNELKTKEAAAKKDPDQLLAVAKWAAENSLADEAKRIYQAILKIKPDHKGANEGLGNELVEGKWLSGKEADALRKKAAAAENATKGLVEIGGAWVEKDKVDDAKRGIFWFDKEVVTKEELLALQSGKVRHPDTGQIIDAKDLEKAKGDYYPVGNDKWVDLKEADTFHSDLKQPWIVRTRTGLFVSTLARTKIQELGVQLDRGVDRVAPLLGNRVVTGAHRPIVIVAATESEFRDFATTFGDGKDACGTFLMREEAHMRLPYIGDVQPAICFNQKDWANNYIRHCAAMSYAHGVAEEAGIDLPFWFLHGIGSYASRFLSDAEGGGFAKAYLKRGPVRNLKGFFAGFDISGEMDPNEIGYNIFLAGLLVSFAANGGETKITETMQAISTCLGTGKGNFDKLVSTLQSELIAAEAKINDYMQKLAAKA